MAIKKQFEDWSNELEKVRDLKTDEDCHQFSDLMYTLQGDEDVCYLDKLIDTIRLKEDYGLYESLYNAIWRFPTKTTVKILTQRLPDLQRRMGKYDQVFRFYIPIPAHEDILNIFLEEAGQWSATDRRTALSAIKNCSIDDERWEIVLEKLGKPVKKTKQDPIPEYWDSS